MTNTKVKGIPKGIAQKLFGGILAFVKDVWRFSLDFWPIILLIVIVGVLIYALLFSGILGPTHRHLYKEAPIDGGVAEEIAVTIANDLAREMVLLNDTDENSPTYYEMHTHLTTMNTDVVFEFEYLFLKSLSSGWYRFGVICSSYENVIICVTHPLDRTY